LIPQTTVDLSSNAGSISSPRPSAVMNGVQFVIVHARESGNTVLRRCRWSTCSRRCRERSGFKWLPSENACYLCSRL